MSMRAVTDEDDSSSSSEVDEDAYSDDFEKDNKQHDEKDSNERLKVATSNTKEESDPDKTSTTSIKEGWLWKKHRKGKLWTGWHRRYFILEENKLEYYRSPAKVKTKRPLGLIMPDSEHGVEFSRRKAGKHDFYEFIIHTPANGMYILAGLTEAGVQSWVNALTSVMRNFRGGVTAHQEPVEELHGPVVKKGFLYRRHPTGKILRSWHKRYFVLFATGRLEWYRIDYKRTRMPRGNLQLSSDWKMDFPRNLKKTKKVTFSPFTLIGLKNEKLELGGDSAEESEAWVNALLPFLQNQPNHPVISTPTKEPVEVVSSPPKYSLEAPEAPAEKFLSPRKPLVKLSKSDSKVSGEEQPSSEPMEGFLYKKYALRRKLSSVWRRRYFVLKAQKLEYFADERMKKLQGSVYLGRDCLVDFPGTTTIRAGNEVYPFSIFTENSENSQIWVKNALLLGSPSKEEAERWVEALQLAIYSRPEIERQFSEVREDDRLTEDDDEDEEPYNRRAFHSLDLSVDGTKLWVPNDFDSSEPVYVDGESDPGPAGTLRCVAVLKSGHNRAILVGRNVNYDVWLSVGVMCPGDLLVVVVSDGRSPDGKTCRCLPPTVPPRCALGFQFPASTITSKSEDSKSDDAVSAVWQYLGEVSSSEEQSLFFSDAKLSLLLLMVAMLILLSNFFGNTLLSSLAVILAGLIFIRGRQGDAKHGPIVWSLKLEKGGAVEPPILKELTTMTTGPITRGQLIPQGLVPAGCTGLKLVRAEMDSVTKAWPPDSGWSISPPESFNVRIGPDYYTTGRPKAPSARYLYRMFDVDVSLSPHKLGEATPFFKFSPEINQQLDRLQQLQSDREPSDRMPPLVVVNFQIPLYPAANPIWGPKNFDGLSGNTQMFAILEDWVLTEPETAPIRLWKKYYHAPNEDKDIKDRFKIITTLVNVDELDLNRVERALERKFNSTPWFSKPDYTCYHGRLALEGKGATPDTKPECEYFEIVTDGHTFSYLARSTVGSVVESFKRMVVNVGFVIEGRTNDELPEQILFGFRIHKVDILHAPRWDAILAQYVNEEKKEQIKNEKEKEKGDEKLEDKKEKKKREKKEKAEREEREKKEAEREERERKERKKREKEERKEKERRERQEKEEKEKKEKQEKEDKEERERAELEEKKKEEREREKDKKNRDKAKSA